jgi:hypothetical protein
VFSVIFASAIILVRDAIPSDLNDAGSWLTSDLKRQQVILAMGLLPFAGIAFLWFIGVMRDRVGVHEDKFFGTVFLGSGLLFVAMTFVAGAGLASLLAVGQSTAVGPDLRHFGRYFFYALMNIYALRMAAVFTMAATTLTGKLGLIPRWLMVLGYLTSAVLLVGVGFVRGLALIFPLWVLAVSLHILVVTNQSTRTQDD